MVAAPAQWLIQLIAYLPDAVRPGVFVALVVAILWLVFVRRGIGDAWRGLCRGSARLVDLVISVALLPEFLMTTARRRRGRPPGRLALLLAGPSEFILDRAASLYARNQREKRSSGKLPWKLCLLLVAASTGAWLVMDNSSPGDPTRRQIAQVYEYWRNVEAWADVNPARRAAPGEAGILEVDRVHRVGYSIRVVVSCPGVDSCAGVMIARNRYGTQVSSAPVAIDANSSATARLGLGSVSPGFLRGLHVIAKQR